MVPRPGLEPGCLAAAHFKCDVSTNFTIEADVKQPIRHENIAQINDLGHLLAQAARHGRAEYAAWRL